MTSMKSAFESLALGLIFSAGLLAQDATAPSQTPVPATSASVTSSGDLPKFPVVSNSFELFDDSVEVREGDEKSDATSYNVSALLDIIPAVKASTQEHLKANVDRKADFRTLFNHPDDFRGRVVQFRATLNIVADHPTELTDKNGAAIQLTRGYATTDYQVLTFFSLEPIPDSIKEGSAILVTGVFMQRFAYINRETPGRKVTWTPLIVVKKLEPLVEKVEQPISNARFAGYIFFSLVAVALLLVYYTRESGRANRANIFRQKRIEKTGKDRLFPGPDSGIKKK